MDTSQLEAKRAAIQQELDQTRVRVNHLEGAILLLNDQIEEYAKEEGEPEKANPVKTLIDKVKHGGTERT